MKQVPKTIGFVNETNPFTDRRAWSGTVFKTREAIENAGFRVVWISYKEPLWAKIFAKVYRKIVWLLMHQEVLLSTHCRFLAKLYAKSIDKKALQACDYLFFAGKAQISLFLKTAQPVIYYTDATVSSMLEYYWKQVSPRSKHIAMQMETAACQHASINLRASDWALQSTVLAHHANPKTTHLLEFGANIDTKDIQPGSGYTGGTLNILFSGVDWSRKGGDIAVETTRQLIQQGIDAKLYIAGIRELPAYCQALDFIVHAGFLDKNMPSEYNEYIRLMRTCHILLLPTQAECAGIVFCEASAFGLPSYTFNTGGTSNYVINGVNGYAFQEADANCFARQIRHDIESGRLPVMREKAMQLYQEKLSWEAWSRRFRSIMDEYEAHD